MQVVTPMRALHLRLLVAVGCTSCCRRCPVRAVSPVTPEQQRITKCEIASEDDGTQLHAELVGVGHLLHDVARVARDGVALGHLDALHARLQRTDRVHR